MGDRLDQFFQDLMVIIVIYNMKLDESPAFRTLTHALQNSRQQASLFVYDNSSQTQNVSSSVWFVTYVHDPSNPGVSKAYNEGFARAKAQRKKWMLLADQDTTFPEDIFEVYERESHRCAVVVPQLFDQRGIVSPLKFYFGGGQRQSKVSTEALKLNDYFFHNSGLLVAADVFEKAGKYDENLPLDFSDFSFVQRLKSVADSFVVADCQCQHKLASTSPVHVGERLHRFSSYLASAKYFKKNYKPNDWLISCRLFLRAVKLSIQYGSLKFLAQYLR